MPKYSKGDRVKVRATRFDNETRDRNGLSFSEKWAADGNGEWCFGAVVHVYAVKGRKVQTYRIKYDDGSSMISSEDHVEDATGEIDSENNSDGDNEMERGDGAESEVSTVFEDRGQRDNEDNDDNEGENDGNVTEDSEGEANERVMMDIRNAREPLEIGDRVECHGYTWERVESLNEDSRTAPEKETTFRRLHFHDRTREVDVFKQLMPLSNN